MKISLFLFSLFMFIGCSRQKQNIYDEGKRNANWGWWVDNATGKGEWIRFGGDSSTLKNGGLTTFYFNGEKCEERKLKDGKEVDTVFGYDLEGLPDFYTVDTTTYIFHDGYRKAYYTTGELLVESNIKNHKYYGVLINYYKNGNKKFIRNYITDSGWSVQFYENGQKKDSIVEFSKKGTGLICKSWFENGQVESTVKWNMKTGLQEGTTKRYYEKEGQTASILESSVDWKGGIWDGVTLLYYPNGQLKDSMFFKEGKNEGVSKSWYENGQLKLINVYKNGDILASKQFDEKGNVE